MRSWLGMDAAGTNPRTVLLQGVVAGLLLLGLDNHGAELYHHRVDDVDAGRQGWARIVREAKLRAMRFGPRPEREQKLAERWHDPRKRKLEPRLYDTVSFTPPAQLEQYLKRFARVFGRRDTLRQAELYLLGLLSSLSRKNGETMEAGVPGITQEGVYRFLARSPWSSEDLDRERVLDALARTGCKDAPVEVIVDECGWRKKGRLSVGVARQYLGVLGKVDNGQVIVSLHLTCGVVDVPGTAELYMPKKQWGGDDDAARRRRQDAGVPADWRARTKPELALALIGRVQAWGLHVLRVHGDCAYAEFDSIRTFLDQGLDVAMGIRANDLLRRDQEPWLPAVPPPPYAGHGRPTLGQASRPVLHTSEELRNSLPAGDWKPMAYRQNVNGQPLTAEFVAIRGRLIRQGKLRPSAPWPADAEIGPLWILLQRPWGGGPQQSEDLKQFVISAPPTMALDELVQIAHHRPLIERNSYENAKQEVGLDQYQGRSWNGLHHHVAMAWLALTWMMLLRRPLPPTPPAFSQPTDGSPPDSLPASAAPPVPPTADPAPAPPPDPLPHASAQASDPLPASEPDHLPDSAAPPPLLIAPLAPSPMPLPRQSWESVQQVHRTLGEWFAGMRAREHLFAILSPRAWRLTLWAGALPPLPSLRPLPTPGP